ncbi:hypothetical protein CERSUDRAFT_117426 [Gelatoporia subvermispora B]|uniref:Uncharacterized protein n=1 Tax=Ceriporiopsis subvermispora (strain B) TaxID=914234 RepID=M2R6N1_CERS8|nr:hypothetical protein CERSUDRAFT_117426 [Gelatoporia subvermispora B]
MRSLNQVLQSARYGRPPHRRPGHSSNTWIRAGCTQKQLRNAHVRRAPCARRDAPVVRRERANWAGGPHMIRGPCFVRAREGGECQRAGVARIVHRVRDQRLCADAGADAPHRMGPFLRRGFAQGR